MSLRIIYSIIYLLFSSILYLIIGYWGDFKSEIEIYFALILPLFITYGIFVYKILTNRFPQGYLWIAFFAVAILIRLLFIPSDPVLSDDVYRYLWDGRVNAAGINPYQFTPESSELYSLRDKEVYPNINFPDIATVYPPLAQFYFLINDWIGGRVVTWKFILLIMEVLVWVLLIRLLNFFSINKSRVFIFIYNPLLIIETYQGGHLEIIGVFFFWLALYEFYNRRDWRSISFYTFAVLTKFLPLFSGIALLWKHTSRKIILMLGIALVLLLPFSLSGTIPLPGLFSYLNRWEFNGAAFQFTVSIFKMLQFPEFKWMTLDLSGHSETFHIGTGYYYKILAVLFFILLVVDQLNKFRPTARFYTISYIQAGFVFTGAILLLTPTLYPWYIIWILPFLIFIPNFSWILFTFLIQFSYFILKRYSMSGIWEESVWVLMLQYVPFYLLLIFEYLDKRNIRGWLIR